MGICKTRNFPKIYNIAFLCNNPFAAKKSEHISL